jgi:hypothetical protein
MTGRFGCSRTVPKDALRHRDNGGPMHVDRSQLQGQAQHDFEDKSVMEPGSRDKKVPVLISGTELLELKRFTWMMSEAFGLDSRIENYQGQRPIGLYRWDFECLLSVLDSAVKRKVEYPDKNAPGWTDMANLFGRLSDEYQSHFGEIA